MDEQSKRTSVFQILAIIGTLVALAVASASGAYNVAVVGATQNEHERRLDSVEQALWKDVANWMRSVDSRLASIEAKLEK